MPLIEFSTPTGGSQQATITIGSQRFEVKSKSEATKLVRDRQDLPLTTHQRQALLNEINRSRMP